MRVYICAHFHELFEIIFAISSLNTPYLFYLIEFVVVSNERRSDAGSSFVICLSGKQANERKKDQVQIIHLVLYISIYVYRINSLPYIATCNQRLFSATTPPHTHTTTTNHMKSRFRIYNIQSLHDSHALAHNYQLSIRNVESCVMMKEKEMNEEVGFKFSSCLGLSILHTHINYTRIHTIVFYITHTLLMMNNDSNVTKYKYCASAQEKETPQEPRKQNTHTQIIANNKTKQNKKQKTHRLRQH